MQLLPVISTNTFSVPIQELSQQNGIDAQQLTMTTPKQQAHLVTKVFKCWLLLVLADGAD